ncbi:AraC family transcriptional regulator [Paraburkholderia humisilvae]|uniref:HTH-type transcriptional activator RhaR n=1 Tax=Paraburkholderia humisilvae TaxID=627669 RepID=A0A6J5ECX1_9BURK|nr:AraC family transcriptional regulator [Paraburkholderia humisilvae]CAB3763156.1 HTH-type transcriptional activator RhaR [Paraburkholderia humisilvae]
MVRQHGHVPHPSAAARDEHWRDVMRSFSVDTRADPVKSAGSHVKNWCVGRTVILAADLRHQILTPLPGEQSCWSSDYLILKLVGDGRGVIEQNGQMRTLNPGDMVMLDPTARYREIVPEYVTGFGFRIPRASLRERGFRYCLTDALVPDVSSPDVQMVRTLIECLGRQSFASSEHVRLRMSEQLLDLMDIVVNDPLTPYARRTAASIVFKAKRFIARYAGDANLAPSTIAAHVCVSEKHLSRLFKAEGISLMRYVLSVRLERAARVLAATPWRRNLVQDVALQCGFSTASHFSHAFRLRFGMPPSEVHAKSGFLTTPREHQAI